MVARPTLRAEVALVRSLRAGVPARIPFRGKSLLGRPLLNKDAAFSDEERSAFGLNGLLPRGVLSMHEQLALELEHVRRKVDPLEKYIGLAALQDRNETLFYRLLSENLEEFLPIVYTPTVGSACESFSHIIRRPRGVWITPDDLDRIPEVLRNSGAVDVRLIVATDNERILGLGDQGAGGMAIPIGKLALYTAGAGIFPALTLPVSLDVGTDRQALLDDPLYAGHRRPRLRGAAYDALIEAFVEGVHEVYPRALIQWEDFKQGNALRILERYRDRMATFNDDIQGTAAVVVAGILTAGRHVGESLAAQRFVFLGAGAAAIGIARLVFATMVREGATEDKARRAIVMLDTQGLIHRDRAALRDGKDEFALGMTDLAAHGLDPTIGTDLTAVIGAVRPTVLIGTTGAAGSFPEAAVREMARHVDRPLIFPLSNPTSRAEAHPADLIRWTGGRAIVAAGSPFSDVVVDGQRHVIGQANNAYCFPGIGLGCIVAEARRVSDEVFLVAARTLAALVSPARLAEDALYPPVAELRSISRRIAIDVARCIRDEGLGRQLDDAAIERAVDTTMWFPEYVPYEPA